MPPLITLSFKPSRAKDFPDILRRCRKFKHFSKGEDYTLEITGANEILEHWLDFMALATRLPQLAGSSATFMGDPVIPFKPDFFYKIQDSLYNCYHKGYKQTPLRHTFCDGKWGCRQVNTIAKSHPMSRWDLHGHWYGIGHFEGDIWKVDKQVIYQILLNEAEIKYLKACPLFSEKRIWEFIDQLPDEIIIDENWEVLTRKELTKNGFKEIPYSIVPKEIDVDDSPIVAKKDKSRSILDFENMSEDDMNDFLDEWMKGWGVN